MDQAKLEAAKSAGREEERKAAAERSKERFARCKDIILVACAVVGGVLGVLGFVRSL